MEAKKKESLNGTSFQKVFDENTFMSMATHGGAQDHDISFTSNILSIKSSSMCEIPEHLSSNSLIRAIQMNDVDQLSHLHRLILPIRYKESYFRKINTKENPEYFGYLIIMEENKKEILGFITGKISEGVAYIYTLGIVPEKQRSGLGTILLKHCIDEFFNQKTCNEIRLFVQTTNQPAINFYKKHCFHILKLESNYYLQRKNDASPSTITGNHDAFEMVLYKEDDKNSIFKRKRVIIPYMNEDSEVRRGLLKRVLDWISRNKCCGGERMNKHSIS